MPVLETRLLTVEPAVAKTVLKMWFQDSVPVKNYIRSCVKEAR